MARFAWQGFSLDHPDDWAPVSVSGTRREGYVRIHSPESSGVQVRWKRGKPGDLVDRLEAYFKRLAQDAKKAKQAFRSETEREDGSIVYRWTGVGQGRGKLFVLDDRVMIVEAIGDRKASLLPIFRRLSTSFSSSFCDGREAWSVFELSLKLPSGFELEKKSFLAGRTSLSFHTRGARAFADRWAFAEQLLAKHTLEDWSRSCLLMPKAQIVQTTEGVELREKHSKALVRLNESKNQIEAIKTNFRDRKWEPQWDWLA